MIHLMMNIYSMHLESVESTDSLEVDNMKVYVTTSRGNTTLDEFYYNLDM